QEGRSAEDDAGEARRPSRALGQTQGSCWPRSRRYHAGRNRHLNSGRDRCDTPPRTFAQRRCSITVIFVASIADRVPRWPPVSNSRGIFRHFSRPIQKILFFNVALLDQRRRLYSLPLTSLKFPRNRCAL